MEELFLEATTEWRQNKNILDFSIANYLYSNGGGFLWNLTEEPDSVIIVVAPITGEIKLLHGLSDLGVTRACPTYKSPP